VSAGSLARSQTCQGKRLIQNRITPASAVTPQAGVDPAARYTAEGVIYGAV
jgi:hypothetical protein